MGSKWGMSALSTQRFEDYIVGIHHFASYQLDQEDFKRKVILNKYWGGYNSSQVDFLFSVDFFSIISSSLLFLLQSFCILWAVLYFQAQTVLGLLCSMPPTEPECISQALKYYYHATAALQKRLAEQAVTKRKQHCFNWQRHLSPIGCQKLNILWSLRTILLSRCSMGTLPLLYSPATAQQQTLTWT